MHLSISEASIYLGVSSCTLRRWDKSFKLIPDSLTPGGHRRYSISSLKTFSGVAADEENKKVIAYSRVSSHDQKEDLKRQSLVLNQYCKKEFSGHEVIEDLGSGMNYKKKGLRKLITMILSGKVSDIVLTHKDRLLRFGSDLIFLICEFFGIRVHIIHEDKDLTDEQLLAFDVLEIITVFSARLYGKRAHKNVKITC